MPILAAPQIGGPPGAKLLHKYESLVHTGGNPCSQRHFGAWWKLMSPLARFSYVLALSSLFLGSLLADDGSTTHDEAKKKRLDAFGYEIFEQNIPGLKLGKRQVSFSDILDRFGELIRTDSQLRDYQDPHPTKGPFQYEELTWYFDGLVLQIGSDLASDNPQTPRRVWIQRVVISKPVYRLKHGLRIGQTASHFVDILGEPTGRNKSGLSYVVDNAVEVKPSVFEVTPYQIAMKLDGDDKVKEIEWTWWWH